ncbi:MAG TPA: hypothetical protein VFW34_08940 [Candidatus Rubrimentiphilum sp.]|nr:hypothetical protein [Candidatus Rubrimentiphilum sp.]
MRAFVIVLVVVALAGVGALELYSHTMSGIRLGGPVPLQSIAPPPVAATPKPMQKNPHALPSPDSTASAAAAVTTSPPQTQSPRILGLSLSPSVVTGGQVVTGTVQTTPDVESVKASIAGYASTLQKVSSGYFALSYRVPDLPAFLHRTYTIVVTAQNARGASVSSSLPITVR